ncbi:MAG: glycoside hydrolase family 3 C-terminal domain-containing protein [Acidobacteria bacterium]|nr:glycoside hydrolase family 3 C-terminal domain-containing protein [Acidobacteriota bacterium]
MELRKSLASVVALLLLVPASISMAQAPVSPSPAIDARANAMIAKMSLDDKLRLIGGVDNFYTKAIPSIDLKRLKMTDGPVGTRTFGPSTAYTASVALAASWDPELAGRVGASLGNDARARGVHFLLAPGVNIYRSPLNGRNMEYLGEDPYLAGRIAIGYINGVQSKGVSATIKHFAANNSEYDRHRINAIVDERTLRELYLRAFEMAIKQAHPGAVMDSYNLINGEHATQNGHLNNDILKGEWKFPNVLMSDWNATYDGVAAANNGLDLEMPFAKMMTAETLKAAIKDGRVKESTIDDKVRRILRTAIQFGWLDRDQYDTSIPLYSLEGDRVALDEAREGITLLKNQNNLLPLDAKKIKTLAIIGPNAPAAVVGGGGSSSTTPFKADSIVAGFASYLGERVKVMYVYGLDSMFEIYGLTEIDQMKVMRKVGNGPEKDITARGERHINYWPRFPARSAPGAQSKIPTTYHTTGTYTSVEEGDYVVAGVTYGGDLYTVQIDGKEVLKHEKSYNDRAETNDAIIHLDAHQTVKVDVRYETHSDKRQMSIAIYNRSEEIPASSRKVIREADAVLVSVGFNPQEEGEGFDRTYTMPLRQNELIKQVSSINPKTIVAINAGGSVETEPWVAGVPALLHTYYLGQEGSRALAEIVFGERSPEGHLPFSWERTLAQNPASAHYEEENGTRDSHYAEGLFLGYRYYTSMKQQPLFPFGFGMSYTNFAISNLKTKRNSGDDVEVSFDVKNIGSREGATVAQVYVGDPSAKVKRPVMELKQFSKVRLKAGEKQHVVLHLDRRAFEYYDVDGKQWKLDPGQFTINVGQSSEKIDASQTFEMM